MQSVVFPRRKLNDGDLLIIRLDDGGYMVIPLGGRVDKLIPELKAIGIAWDLCSWSFYCPADRLGSLMRFCFVRGLRTGRTA